MKLGVCYYPDQWPEARWPVDAQMMVDAGLEVVRIAEFAWALMEPAEGRYEWGWLDRAIDVLAGAGLKVILGTPTVTPPAWLTAAHPEMLHVDPNGRARRHGSRRQACVNNPTYRDYSARIATAMADRYGRDSRVVGWQIDNEFGGGKTGRCYCEACTAGFRRWLRRRYGTLEALNDAWGTVFWSQLYSDWEQIQVPDNAIDKPNPSHVLDFYRYSSDGYVAYQQLQVDILRARTSGFITTNFMGLYRDLDQFDLAAPLDFVTWDNYPSGNPDRWRPLLYPPGRDASKDDPVYAFDAGEAIIVGMAHALTRALKGGPFWVMEQQCGVINWGAINPWIRPGTVSLWTWHALAEGADTCVYFRWRPTLFSQEQYHSGMLHHDASPAVGLEDVRSLAPERERMAAIAAEPFAAEVALLFSFDDLWALELQEQRKGFNYLRHLYVYYESLQRMGIQVDLVPPGRDLAAYKLVLAPTVHLPDEALVAQLTAYVRNGGTLLLGPRSGFKTPTNTVVDRPLPGLLRDLAGATVTSWQSLPDGVSLALSGWVPGLAGSRAGFWFETLEPTTGETLASFETGESAAVLHRVGSGSVVTLGWFPTSDQVETVVSWFGARAGLIRGPVPPPGCLVFRRGPYTIGLNFTDTAHSMAVDGTHMILPPRGVAVHPEGAPEG
jgi:beta-galactosidase